MSATALSAGAGPERRVVAAMLAIAVSLAVMSVLHLTGTLDPSAQPSHVSDAGVAEAIICVVLVIGAAGLARGRRRLGALASLAFAVLGFLVGLASTIQGGSAIDLAYHATVLPLLALTAAGLIRRMRGAGR